MRRSSAALAGLLTAVVAATQTHPQVRAPAPAQDIRVTLLGTGTPILNIERFGMSTLVQAGGQTLLFDAGRYPDAVTHFEEAVKNSPTPANRIALAQAYIKNKQPDKALPIVQQVLQSQPNDYDLRMLCGRLIRDQRKFPEAAQQFLAAVQLKPDSAEAWSELAGVLVLAENYPGAIAALDKLAALHAEKPGHVYLRAIVLDKIHQLKPALESYQRFLAMDQGKDPDEDFKARQRARIIERELSKR